MRVPSDGAGRPQDAGRRRATYSANSSRSSGEPELLWCRGWWSRWLPVGSGGRGCVVSEASPPGVLLTTGTVRVREVYGSHIRPVARPRQARRLLLARGGVRGRARRRSGRDRDALAPRGGRGRCGVRAGSSRTLGCHRFRIVWAAPSSSGTRACGRRRGEHGPRVEQVGEVGVVAGLPRQARALLEVLAGAAVVASAQLHLQEVVEGDVGRQPVLSGAWPRPGPARCRTALSASPSRRWTVPSQMSEKAQVHSTSAPPCSATDLATSKRSGPSTRSPLGERHQAFARHGVGHDRRVVARMPVAADHHQRGADVVHGEGHRGGRELRAGVHVLGRLVVEGGLRQPTAVVVVAAQPPVEPQLPRHPGRGSVSPAASERSAAAVRFACSSRCVRAPRPGRRRGSERLASANPVVGRVGRAASSHSPASRSRSRAYWATGSSIRCRRPPSPRPEDQQDASTVPRAAGR